MKVETLTFVVPLLYAAIHTIDVIASYSRVSGSMLMKNSIAYTMQTATTAFTRVFNMILLPILGLFLDIGVDKNVMLNSFMISFLLCGITSLLAYYNSTKLLKFYANKIKNKLKEDYFDLDLTYPNFNLREICINKNVALMATFVYSINAVSILLTFYFASIFTDYQVMISQMSGVINALATFIMTMKLDPIISIKIEKQDGYVHTHQAIVISRVFSFFVICPSTFLIVSNLF